jgi:hypothetical protein
MIILCHTRIAALVCWGAILSGGAEKLCNWRLYKWSSNSFVSVPMEKEKAHHLHVVYEQAGWIRLSFLSLSH